MSTLTLEQLLVLRYDWKFWARAKQRKPTKPFTNWLVLAGRGWGKTKTGAETVREWVNEGYQRFALVGPTMADVRDTMITGDASGPDEGLINAFPPHQRPRYNPSKRVVNFHTGAKAFAFSAEEPERLRGPQNEKAWCDELRAWQRPDETWSNLKFNMRRGDNPQRVITTTPKPTKLLNEILNDPDTITTRGATWENEANLNAKFLEDMEKLRGTKIGRQELEAEILQDIEGALWTQGMIDEWRVTRSPQLSKIVVSIDPATTDGEESDAAGILGVGLGYDGHRYVLADKTIHGRPKIWASEAVKLVHRLQADCIVAEVNQGGLMVQETIETVDDSIKIEMVHATRGKRTRAEPISAQYEKGLWHHVGTFQELETEMTGWIPGQPSPNRMDALVWAGHKLGGTISKFGATVI